jgi:hypothetical protein
MKRIFISYRRDDSAADMTDRVYEHLVRRWKGRVFMDIDSLKAGDLFANRIEENLQNCAVMLAMMGRHWASLTDEQGARRIDDPGDYPRMEVATALKRGIRVIPVLVGNTPLPRREELPSDIAGLVDRQVLRLSREGFDADMERLMSSVAQDLPRNTWAEMRFQTLAVAVVLALLLFGILAYYKLGPSLFPEKRQVSSSSANVNLSKDGSDTFEPVPKKERPNPGGPNISGKWRTAPFRNVYSRDERSTIVFDFTQSGDTVMGTVTETVRNVYSSENGGQTDTIGILEGKIRDTVVSFYTKGELTDNTVYKEMYTGVLQKDGREIAFQRIDDLPTGGLVERFVARPK